jgi:hypothetical protein
MGSGTLSQRYDRASKKQFLRVHLIKYAETTKSNRGTKEVDVAFLEEISSWRKILARNIAIRNQKLNVKELNSAVQNTIDRIIILRICEDRGVLFISSWANGGL